MRTLRLSVIDRCPHRCGYCRPGLLTPFVDRGSWLSPADYARLAPVFAELGVEKVRFTGGEPLLRTDLEDVLSAVRVGLPRADLAVTTNGLLLSTRLRALARAGLSRATVHVDTLDPSRYRTLMGEGDVARVLDGVLDAREVLAEVKLNVVVQRGRNDDELLEFLEWSRVHRVEVRFIELMNTGSAIAYARESFVSGREIVTAVRARVGARPLIRLRPSDPASRFVTDHGVVFGVIASDTEPFCDACNRLRLTVDGRLRGCLYEGAGVPLREAARTSGFEQLSALVRDAVAHKRSHHPSRGRRLTLFSMSERGG
ncbi:MAG: radical SAM protein [Deltaproteobacteria bacterium]|nr:radical SAM protein [Deltaproteobacteria bacterium]